MGGGRGNFVGKNGGHGNFSMDSVETVKNNSDDGGNGDGVVETREILNGWRKTVVGRNKFF